MDGTRPICLALLAGAFASLSSPVAAQPPTAAVLVNSDLRYQELIHPRRTPDGTVSVGTSTHGRLYGGVALPAEGPGFATLPGCAQRHTRWGTSDLVRLLVDTAATLPEGRPMLVCNLSREGGGNISWSRSHNSGRDADIAFFMLRKGEPFTAPGMWRFNRHGVSFEDPDVTFDVARNWQLVRALITHGAVQPQWVFVYNPLRRSLLRHAKEIGESPALIARAEQIVWQPSDARRHHDHFHVRVFCNGQDRAEGCLDGAPLWEWFSRDRDPMTRRSSALAMGLRDPDLGTRTAVLDYIEKTAAWDAAPAILELAVFERDHPLRLRAAEIMSRWRHGDAAVAWALETFLRSSSDAYLAGGDFGAKEPAGLEGVPVRWLIGEGRTVTHLHVRRAYKLLGKMASPATAPFLARAMQSQRLVQLSDEDPSRSVPEALLAARAANHVLDLSLVPPLMATLTHDNPKVRVAANRALRRVTVYRLGVAWGESSSTQSRARNLERWQTWWSDHGHRTREDHLVRGLKRAGVRVNSWKDPELPKLLVPLTARRDEIGYNADRVLCEITGGWSPRHASPESRHRRWEKWASARARR